MKNIILNLSPEGSLIIKYEDGSPVDLSKLSFKVLNELNWEIRKILDSWENFFQPAMGEYKLIEPKNLAKIPLEPDSTFEDAKEVDIPAYCYSFDFRIYAPSGDDNRDVMKRIQGELDGLGIKFIDIDPRREVVYFYLSKREDVLVLFDYLYKKLTPSMKDLVKSGTLLKDKIIKIKS
jgi:hypothetical protein